MPMERLHGALALAIIFAGYHGFMIDARRGSPLAVVFGDDAMYLGSDALALAPFTRRICYLEEDEWAAISATVITRAQASRCQEITTRIRAN